MLKYVAVLKVYKPDRSGKWRFYEPGPKYFISSIESEKSKVEKWLSDEIKKYPDANVNSDKFDKEYVLKTTIIAFDDKESENVERFLEKLNYPT